jgi:hypothetical protein
MALVGAIAPSRQELRLSLKAEHWLAKPSACLRADAACAAAALTDAP